MRVLMALAWFAAALPTAVVLKPVAHMYAQHDSYSEIVSQAIYGTGVGVVETRGGWMKVRTPDDYSGWMASGRSAWPGRSRASSRIFTASRMSLSASRY